MERREVKLLGKVAVVTGASRGLGNAIAQRLLAEGAHLVLTAREEGPLRAVGRALVNVRADPTQQVLYEPADISRPEQVERLMALADETFGQLDVLVCNAGINGPIGPSESVDWSEWVRAIEINLLGTVLCCRAAVTIMRRQGRGKIIALSGGGATQPRPRLSAYAAAKAGVVRFAETLAAELEGSGIDVNCVAPGALNTRMLDEVLRAGPERVGSAVYERALHQQREGGTPLEKGADLISFLASAESDGISGRLLSAVWDDWSALPRVRARLAQSDVYTLRRIVPADRGWDGV